MYKKTNIGVDKKRGDRKSGRGLLYGRGFGGFLREKMGGAVSTPGRGKGAPSLATKENKRTEYAEFLWVLTIPA